MLCPVITIGADELLFNHRSHRVRSQLEDDPEWQEVKGEPHAELAQDVIARLIREDRTEERFATLKESLHREGQEYPGLITRDGLLVNGNTRAVAIRAFPPGRRQIRVGVLPETVTPRQINVIELRLQMQEDFKGDYSLTNELLFIEELSQNEWAPQDIAREMRVHPSEPSKGALEIQTRLKILDLLRVMREIPDAKLPLRYFDKLALEQMRGILRTHESLMKGDPRQAQVYLDTILLSVLSGVKSVHQLRRVDTAFVSDYVASSLEDDERLTTIAPYLLTPIGKTGSTRAKGVQALLGAGTAMSGSQVDVRRLIDIVTQQKKTVEFQVDGGPRLVVEKADIADAIETAFKVGIRDKKSDQNAENRLDASTEGLKNAVSNMTKAIEALRLVVDDNEFDQGRRNKLGQAFKKLRQRFRDTEDALAKAGIVEKRQT